MFFLLSPSKSQNFTDEIPENIVEYIHEPEFMNMSEEIVSFYKNFSTEELQKIFSVSENIASLNVERFNLWKKNAKKSDKKPAIQAFTGTVYNNFEYKKYSKNQCKYADENLKIISGLYGIISPFSLIQPYRLEMGTRQKIEIENIGSGENKKLYKNLYDFWKNILTEKIISDFATLTQKNITDEKNKKIIINLASVEYSKVLDMKKLEKQNIRIISIDFKVWKDNKKNKKNKTGKKVLKTIAIYAKKQRGEMMDWCIKNMVSSVEEMKKYESDGFVFSEKYSETERLCFVCQN